MLQLIPAPLHRALYRLADKARRLWWRVRRPQRSGVLVVLVDAAGRVLLARHSYGPRVWTLPGGGVGRGEDPAETARREMREELSCEIGALRLVERETESDSGSVHHFHLFAATPLGDPVADGREIVEIGWFAPDALPPRTSRQVPGLIALARAVPLQQR